MFFWIYFMMYIWKVANFLIFSPPFVIHFITYCSCQLWVAAATAPQLLPLLRLQLPTVQQSQLLTHLTLHSSNKFSRYSWNRTSHNSRYLGFKNGSLCTFLWINWRMSAECCSICSFYLVIYLVFSVLQQFVSCRLTVKITYFNTSCTSLIIWLLYQQEIVTESSREPPIELPGAVDPHQPPPAIMPLHTSGVLDSHLPPPPIMPGLTQSGDS